MPRIVVIAIVLTISTSVYYLIQNWERTRRVEIKLIIEPVQWIEPIGTEEGTQAI